LSVGEEKISEALMQRAERIAMDFAMKQNDLVHERMNFWLVTEGLLLAAIGAIMGSSSLSENYRSSVVLLLSIGGIILTVLWHSIMARASSWGDWYFTRLQTIHKLSFNPPDHKHDDQKLGVFPRKQYFGFWKGEGLRVSIGSLLIAALFLSIWYFLVKVSLPQLSGLDSDKQNGATILLILIIGYIVVLAYHEYKRWLEDRKAPL
jgi:hypothetical protein